MSRAELHAPALAPELQPHGALRRPNPWAFTDDIRRRESPTTNVGAFAASQFRRPAIAVKRPSDDLQEESRTTKVECPLR